MTELLPFPWRFTARQLEAMDDDTFASVRPVMPIRPTITSPGARGLDGDAALEAERSWWLTHYEPYRKALTKWEAEKRRRASMLAPHPNWENRKHRCAVHVELDFGSKRAVNAGYKNPHRARWERVHVPCGEQPVAWDGTDRRRTGYLYGACAKHLRQAMADDPARRWYWTTGTLIDDTFDLDGETTILALGGLKAGA